MMYRVKVPLIAAFVVLVATVGIWLRVAQGQIARIDADVDSRVVRAQAQLAHVSRSQGVDLMAQAGQFAREDAFIQIFSKATDEERNQAAYIECDVRRAALEKEGRKPGIIGVIDAQGLLVARDLNQNWRHGDDFRKEYPSLDAALKGIPNKDVWSLDGAMYMVGSAPIRGPQGTIAGAVFIGYVASTRDAGEAKAITGTDVAFFLDGKIHASSLPKAEGGSSESTEEKALAKELFDGKAIKASLVEGGKPKALRVKIGNDEWSVSASLGPASGVPGANTTASQSGFVSLVSLTAARSPVMPETFLVLTLGIIGLLATLLAAMLTERRFLVPLDRVESGVSEVINGNRDFVFESPSADYEGLANGLNVMLARLLGRPDPDEDDEGGGGGDSLRSME